MVMDNIDRVFGIIKNIYIENDRRSVPHYAIADYIKKEMLNIPSNKIPFVLKVLHQRGRIIFGDMPNTYIPILTDVEVAKFDKDRMQVTMPKIRKCIEYFEKVNSRSPISSEIVDVFIQLFGEPNVKDMGRFIRNLGSCGSLRRFGNPKRPYYTMPDSRNRMTTLRNLI
jgi:hypothetical protein